MNLSRLGASGTGERNFANNLRYIESSERLLVSGEDKSDARGYSTANMANYQGRGVLIELGVALPWSRHSSNFDLARRNNAKVGAADGLENSR